MKGVDNNLTAEFRKVLMKLSKKEQDIIRKFIGSVHIR